MDETKVIGESKREEGQGCNVTMTDIDTHHRCSGFSIGSSAWNPSCPSLAVTRTTTASSSSSSSSATAAGGSAPRPAPRRSLPLDLRSPSSLSLSLSQGRNDPRWIEIVIVTRWVSFGSRHYLGGSIAVVRTGSLARSFVNRGSSLPFVRSLARSRCCTARAYYKSTTNLYRENV